MPEMRPIPGMPRPATAAVGYTYQIGKYEVTAGQYTRVPQRRGQDRHLRPVQLRHGRAIDGYLRLQDPAQRQFGQLHVQRGVGLGEPAGELWSPGATRPGSANWLHNGQPTGPQDPGRPRTGSYTLNGATSQAELDGA